MGVDGVKKVLALSMLAALLLMMGDIPTLSESVSKYPYDVYEEYQDALFALQKDITQLYMEVHQRKNPEVLYRHMLKTIEAAAVLVGKAEPASHNIHNILQISLQDRMEMLLIEGLPERQKENLINLGYTEEDIVEFLDWILTCNDNYHHSVSGFTPEEKNRLYAIGLTDEQISELQTYINGYYTQLHTAQHVVKQHQTELIQIQLLLSLAASQILPCFENDDNESNRLHNAEEKLLEAVLYVSKDQSSLEQVKAFSKEVYKAAEKEVREGEGQYLVDFFVGLQVHCGALTALNGDTESGLAEIKLYEHVLSECVASPERPLPLLMQVEEKSFLEDTVQVSDFVGQIEESDETNNLGCILVFVKAPDTTIWQATVMLFSFISVLGEVNLTLDELVTFLGSFIGATLTVTKLAFGSVGALLLLIITAPSVGEGWPTVIEYDPSNIFDKIYVDEGTIVHIQERAQSEDKCERWSHQAIIDDPWRIRFTIEHAMRVYVGTFKSRYFYYVTDGKHEWAAVVEKMGEKTGRVVTAYRIDCAPPYECGGKFYMTWLEKWEKCENFTLVWPV